MKILTISASALAMALVVAGPAHAAGKVHAKAESAKPAVEIVSRGPDGRADVVKVDGYEYKVCKGDQADSCINPRDAGLNWGSRDLQYWPGRPASEISGPLPATQPAVAPASQPG